MVEGCHGGLEMERGTTSESRRRPLKAERRLSRPIDCLPRVAMTPGAPSCQTSLSKLLRRGLPAEFPLAAPWPHGFRRSRSRVELVRAGARNIGIGKEPEPTGLRRPHPVAVASRRSIAGPCRATYSPAPPDAIARLASTRAFAQGLVLDAQPPGGLHQLAQGAQRRA